MLLNSMLFNSEAWHGIVRDNVETLSRVDESLLRGLVNAHAKGRVPKKKIQNVNFFQIGVDPPPSKCKLFDKNFKHFFCVPKLLLLLLELTKTHLCVKEIRF